MHKCLEIFETLASIINFASMRNIILFIKKLIAKLQSLKSMHNLFYLNIYYNFSKTKYTIYADKKDIK